MASYTRNFENSFAKKLGVSHALMVNSGSSANLLAVFAAGNLLRKSILLSFKTLKEIFLIPISKKTLKLKNFQENWPPIYEKSSFSFLSFSRLLLHF